MPIKKQIAVAASHTADFSPYIFTSNSEFNQFLRNSSVWYTGDSADLDICKYFFNHDSWREAWIAFIKCPKKTIDSETFFLAYNAFKNFFDFVQFHRLQLHAFPSGINAYSKDQGESLRTALRIIQRSTNKQVQLDNLEFIPKRSVVDQWFNSGIKILLSEHRLLNYPKEYMFSQSRLKIQRNTKVHTDSYLGCFLELVDRVFEEKNSTITLLDIRHFFKQAHITILDHDIRNYIFNIVLKSPIQDLNVVNLTKLLSAFQECEEKVGSDTIEQLIKRPGYKEYQSINQLIKLFFMVADAHSKGDISDVLRKLSEDTNVTLDDVIRVVRDQTDIQSLPSQSGTIDKFTKKITPDLDFPIRNDKLTLLNSQLKILNQVCDELSTQPIRNVYRSIRDIQAKDEHSSNDKLTILAAIRLLIRRHFGIYPYDLQMVIVLAVIQFEPAYKGMLAQVKTGEGKSTLTAIICGYYGILGKCVDVTTSTRSLAIRDAKKYREFYRSLGISTSHICHDSKIPSQYNAQILFGTLYDFEWSVLFDNIFNCGLRLDSKTKKPRPFDVVVVDEVDHAMLDIIENAASVGGGSNIKQAHKWIYGVVLDFYKDHQIRYQENAGSVITECIERIKKIACRRHFSISVSDDIIAVWVTLAHHAITKFEEGRDYVIYPSQDYITGEIRLGIVFVNWNTTGTLRVNCRYNNGLHALLEYKHNLPIRNDFHYFGQIPHSVYFPLYDTVLGLTGTIGSDIERQEIETLYSLQSFDAPTYHPCIRQELPPVICRTQSEFYETLAGIAQEMITKGRPVLFILMTIKETQTLADIIKKRSIECRLYNAIQTTDDEYIIAGAGIAGAITIATNTAGRGTDIILSELSKKNGGLHAVLGGFFVSQRAKNQALGRAGRQGQPGSWQYVICEEIERERNDVFDDPRLQAFRNQPADYFSVLETIASELTQKQSEKREFVAKLHREQFKYLKRFFAVIHQFSCLNKTSNFLIFSEYLQGCNLTDPTTELSDVEQELREAFSALTSKNHKVLAGWIKSLFEKMILKIQSDWGKTGYNIMMTHEIAQIKGLDRSEKYFECYCDQIKILTADFFDLYLLCEQEPVRFFGELLTRLGIKPQNINKLDNSGSTPLLRAFHHAVIAGELDIVKWLATHPLPDSNRKDPIYKAIEHNHDDIVEYLAKTCGWPLYPTARTALENGDDRIVIACIKLGLDIHGYAPEMNKPIFFYAIYNNRIELVRTLLQEYGADPELLDLKNRKAIHIAAISGLDDMLELLNQFNGLQGITHRSNEGTPIELAWEWRKKTQNTDPYDNCIKWLYGAFKIQLQSALDQDDQLAIYALLTAGFQLSETQSTLLCDPLYDALLENNMAMASCLIYKGHWNLQITAISAISQHNFPVLQQLIAFGIPVNGIFCKDWTLLKIAAYHKFSDAVTLLLDHGADWRFVDSTGRTALHHAISMGDLVSVKKIFEYSNIADYISLSPHFSLIAAADEYETQQSTQNTSATRVAYYAGYNSNMQRSECMILVIQAYCTAFNQAISQANISLAAQIINLKYMRIALTQQNSVSSYKSCVPIFQSLSNVYETLTTRNQSREVWCLDAMVELFGSNLNLSDETSDQGITHAPPPISSQRRSVYPHSETTSPNPADSLVPWTSGQAQLIQWALARDDASLLLELMRRYPNASFRLNLGWNTETVLHLGAAYCSVSCLQVLKNTDAFTFNNLSFFIGERTPIELAIECQKKVTPQESLRPHPNTQADRWRYTQADTSTILSIYHRRQNAFDLSTITPERAQETIQILTSATLTQLNQALQSNNGENAKRLMDSGIDLTAQGDTGLAAIHIVAIAGHLELIRWMVSKKIELKTPCRRGFTMMDYVVGHYHQNCADYLIKHLKWDTYKTFSRIVHANDKPALDFLIQFAIPETHFKKIISELSENEIQNIERKCGSATLVTVDNTVFRKIHAVEELKNQNKVLLIRRDQSITIQCTQTPSARLVPPVLIPYLAQEISCRGSGPRLRLMEDRYFVLIPKAQ